jgi:hypothetical protein
MKTKRIAIGITLVLVLVLLQNVASAEHACQGDSPKSCEDLTGAYAQAYCYDYTLTVCGLDGIDCTTNKYDDLNPVAFKCEYGLEPNSCRAMGCTWGEVVDCSLEADTGKFTTGSNFCYYNGGFNSGPQYLEVTTNKDVFYTYVANVDSSNYKWVRSSSAAKSLYSDKYDIYNYADSCKFFGDSWYICKPALCGDVVMREGDFCRSNHNSEYTDFKAKLLVVTAAESVYAEQMEYVKDGAGDWVIDKRDWTSAKGDKGGTHIDEWMIENTGSYAPDDPYAQNYCVEIGYHQSAPKIKEYICSTSYVPAYESDCGDGILDEGEDCEEDEFHVAGWSKVTWTDKYRSNLAGETVTQKIYTKPIPGIDNINFDQPYTISMNIKASQLASFGIVDIKSVDEDTSEYSCTTSTTTNPKITCPGMVSGDRILGSLGAYVSDGKLFLIGYNSYTADTGDYIASPATSYSWNPSKTSRSASTKMSFPLDQTVSFEVKVDPITGSYTLTIAEQSNIKATYSNTVKTASGFIYEYDQFFIRGISDPDDIDVSNIAVTQGSTDYCVVEGTRIDINNYVTDYLISDSTLPDFTYSGVYCDDSGELTILANEDHPCPYGGTKVVDGFEFKYCSYTFCGGTAAGRYTETQVQTLKTLYGDVVSFSNQPHSSTSGAAKDLIAGCYCDYGTSSVIGSTVGVNACEEPKEDWVLTEWTDTYGTSSDQDIYTQDIQGIDLIDYTKPYKITAEFKLNVWPADYVSLGIVDTESLDDPSAYVTCNTDKEGTRRIACPGMSNGGRVMGAIGAYFDSNADQTAAEMLIYGYSSYVEERDEYVNNPSNAYSWKPTGSSRKDTTLIDYAESDYLKLDIEVDPTKHTYTVKLAGDDGTDAPNYYREADYTRVVANVDAFITDYNKFYIKNIEPEDIEIYKIFATQESTFTCVEGKTSCGDKCVDLQTDNNYCGTCGTKCVGDAYCEDGACRLSCDSGYTWDATTESCEVRWTMFISETTTDGSISSGTLIGIPAANEICQHDAYDAGLTGEYIALISSGSQKIKTKLPSSGKFVNVLGTEIASDRADLFDGSIKNLIKYQADEDPIGGHAWTGSDVYGNDAYAENSQVRDDADCDDWKSHSSNANEYAGGLGQLTKTDSNWIDYGDRECSRSTYRLICVQVAKETSEEPECLDDVDCEDDGNSCTSESCSDGTCTSGILNDVACSTDDDLQGVCRLGTCEEAAYTADSDGDGCVDALEVSSSITKFYDGVVDGTQIAVAISSFLAGTGC